MHGFAVLVQRGRSNLGQATIGMRRRGTNLQHLAFEVKRVARPHRLWPAEFVHSGSHNAAGNRQAADEKPHRDRGCVPAARGEPTEQGSRRFLFIQMKRLWIELAGESFDLRDADLIRNT